MRSEAITRMRARHFTFGQLMTDPEQKSERSAVPLAKNGERQCLPELFKSVFKLLQITVHSHANRDPPAGDFRRGHLPSFTFPHQ